MAVAISVRRRAYLVGTNYILNGHHQRMSVSGVAPPGFEPVAQRACRTGRARHIAATVLRENIATKSQRIGWNDREHNVAETTGATRKINNLEDIHCVRDTGVAGSNPATQPKANSQNGRCGGIAAVGPFGQGPLDVWQFAIVGFLAAAKGERLDSAGVLYQLLRLRMANLSFGRIAPESPAPEGMDKTGRSRFPSV
jgi:hypothetical protein